MDRFSLALLNPGEIYFTDFAVSIYLNCHPHGKVAVHSAYRTRFHSDTNANSSRLKSVDRDTNLSRIKPINGRLKVCSKCLVFVPQCRLNGDNLMPMLKFHFKNITKVDEWSSHSMEGQDNKFLSVETNLVTEMMTDNKVGPYNSIRFDESMKYVFLMRFASLQLLRDRMTQVHQLIRTSRMAPGDQAEMIRAIEMSRQMRIPFDQCWLDSCAESIVFKTIGQRIRPLTVNPGRIVLTSTTLYFQPYNNVELRPFVAVSLSSVTKIYRRRYMLRPRGLEVFFRPDKAVDTSRWLSDINNSLYLVFHRDDDRLQLYTRLVDLCSDHADVRPGSPTSVKMSALQWQRGKISNFDYLMELNMVGGRSFNDLAQYPVYPWVLADYTSDVLDLGDPNTFRDLSKPVGALNIDRLEALHKRMIDMEDCTHGLTGLLRVDSDNVKSPTFLYGTHYSTPAFVLHYLVRQCPELMLCLQGGKFDHPDRLFNSVAQAWHNVTHNLADFKELVPQFYDVQLRGIFLRNVSSIDFGRRHCGRPVGDVELPPWAGGDATNFVRLMRSALESDHVSANLHTWIDLVFGCRQRGQAALDADNLFHPLSYDGSIEWNAVKDDDLRAAVEVQIAEFGQVPDQVFSDEHPRRNQT